MPKELVMNTRSLLAPLTGVQRYASEILKRHPEVRQICPSGTVDGIKGHLWEQVVLPAKLRGRLLWSPSNTGPIGVRNQVLTLHDLSAMEHPEWFDTKFAQWYNVMVPLLARNVKHILTVSEYSRQGILKRFNLPEDRVSVTWLAASDIFKPMVGEILENHLRSQNLGRYLLSVGSLEPRKNLALLFRAWTMWQDRPEDLTLVVVGGAGKVFSGLGFQEAPPGVRLLGRVPDSDLPYLYSGAEAFVFPSIYEGFGLPPLEALACGTPVITTRQTSLPEVVGDAGLYVEPNDANSLLDAMRTLTSDPHLRAMLSQEGLEHARKFSWDRTADFTWRVLQSQLHP